MHIGACSSAVNNKNSCSNNNYCQSACVCMCACARICVCVCVCACARARTFGCTVAIKMVYEHNLHCYSVGSSACCLRDFDLL